MCQWFTWPRYGFLGAMMYIVVEEILLEMLHKSSTYRKISAAGFFLGFYVMWYLDLLLG